MTRAYKDNRRRKRTQGTRRAGAQSGTGPPGHGNSQGSTRRENGRKARIQERIPGARDANESRNSYPPRSKDARRRVQSRTLGEVPTQRASLRPRPVRDGSSRGVHTKSGCHHSGAVRGEFRQVPRLQALPSPRPAGQTMERTSVGRLPVRPGRCARRDRCAAHHGVKVRENGQVRQCSLLIATGIDESGHRHLLGFALGDKESEASWKGFFTRLQERGLSGVDLVVSDDHAGLVKAIEGSFIGASWQRCQAHFLRNLSDACPKTEVEAFLASAKQVLWATDLAGARTRLSEVCLAFEG